MDSIPRVVVPLCGGTSLSKTSDHLPLGDFYGNFKLFSLILNTFSRARDCVCQHPASPFVYLKAIPQLEVLTVDKCRFQSLRLFCSAAFWKQLPVSSRDFTWRVDGY